MTKKRLSDLLKEEVQKDETPAAEGQQGEAPKPAASDKPPAAKPARTSRTAPSRRTTGRRTAAPVTPAKSVKPAPEPAPEPVPEPVPAAITAAATESASPPLSSDSADQVSELEQALQAAQAREVTLQNQVSGLQEDLRKQQERLFELKDLLEKATAAAADKTSQLTKVAEELAAAKQDMLKAAATAKPTYAGRRSGADVIDRRTYNPPRPAADLKPLAGQAVQTSSVSNSMLSNDEIGWVD